ncbi:MAG: hypothetical protein M0T78_06600 [Actinomycetota bacterium]|nr:hypothetical protein [Actinomycetota bacterium]
MVLIAIVSRLLAWNSSRYVHISSELSISVILILLGSFHGTLDIFKLISLEKGRKANLGALYTAFYVAAVMLGIAALIFDTLISVLIFLSISIIHFTIVEFDRRASTTGFINRLVASIATSIAVFSFSFRVTSSLASSMLQRLLGDERVAITISGLGKYLAVGSLIVVLISSLMDDVARRNLVEDISLLSALLISPGLVAFSIFYGLRHGVDQWTIDRKAVNFDAVKVRVLVMVMALTMFLLFLTFILAGPLVAFVSLGFGLTLAHISLDVGYRLRL